MFGNILKMLFFYKIFTFSQYPKKFYYKNFNRYTLKKQKYAQNNSLNFIQIWSNWEREEERVIENFRERKATMRSRRDWDDEIIGAMRSRWWDRWHRRALGRERERDRQQQPRWALGWERERCELRTWRHKLDGAISPLRLGLGLDLAAASGVGARSCRCVCVCVCESSFLSLFLSLRVYEFRKWFEGKIKTEMLL